MRLELKDFKSYRGHHVLLFGDSYFTSIIGPNGSGKSNSMDAISFVLGIKSSHLRSTQLRDLVYRGRVIRTTRINADGTATEATNGDAGEGEDGTQSSSRSHDPQSAWVMAVYEDDAGEEHKWKRTITSAGQSEYRINNRVVTAKQYNEALEAEDILIKARNFLVFQGDVEAVASQSPKELTRLIEQISGSLEYKAEYERLKDESEKAMEEQTFRLNQRRAINAEIKTYQEQKEEAEAYERKVAERDQAIVTHVLWKLFHFQQTMEASSNEIQKHQEELKEHKRVMEKYEQKLEEARRNHEKVAREVGKTEKVIRGKKKSIEESEAALVPIDEKIRISTADLQKYKDRVASIKKERDNQNELLERHKKDLAMVKKAQKKWEDEFSQAAQAEGRELSEADLQEYNRLRSEVTKRTHGHQMEVNNLSRQVRSDEETVNSLKSKAETAQAQVERLEEEIRELQQRQQELKARGKELQETRNSKQQEFNRLQSDRLKVAQQQTELNERLQETLRKLYEADSGRRQSEKEMRTREAVAQMKRIFGSGVHGRYTELCTPKQRKYETAVSTLLGWHLDAIIVDKESTARDCIQYLKEQKLGQFNFVPLDTIQIKTINPNIKGMHKGMRLGIDCIDYDSSLERAMAHACGNSVVCDDLKVARHLCYERGLDAKAVTLDGTVISKGGTMTGGRLGGDQGSKRWADAEVEKLQKFKDKLMASLAALPKASRRGQEEETLQVELADLEHRIYLTQEELKHLERNVQDKKKEYAFAKGQLREVEPKYQEQSQRLQNIKDRLQASQDGVAQVADEVFAAFCQRLGYSNIREYEAQQGTVQQEAAQKRLEFTKQRSRLENMIQFETSRLQATDERLQSLEEKSKRDEATLETLEAEKEKIDNEIDVLNAEIEQFEETLSTLREKLARRAEVVSEQRRERDKRNEAVKDVNQAVSGLEAEIKRTASQRYALLRKCRVDEIKIPLTADSGSLNSLPMGDVAGEEMDLDDDVDATQIQAPEVDDYGIEVDFDELDEELQENDSAATEAKLTEAITGLTAEIEKANPNMRAMERLETTNARLNSTNKEFEDARKSAKRAKDDFEKVKQKRHDLFQKAFTHIAEQIGSTYKDLTRSAQFPLGGQAYLDMEDSTEPYLAGLKYHAMPPLKRFRDMEHLSGGEKTIAALALLFAIHSYQPSPFFVLDEVDAALDNVNVARVAKYVKEHANPGMQFIVISLKAGLFQESESLVGVMRDQGRMSSKVVSLDLRKYLPS